MCKEYLMSHFWVGSFFCCYSVIVVERKNNPKFYFPSAVVGASDIIRICEDLEKIISQTSTGCSIYWNCLILALLILIIGRLNNLICQFNEYDNFWAIFAGVNRYKFTKVVPIVGHSYLREIILHKPNNSIE